MHLVGRFIWIIWITYRYHDHDDNDDDEDDHHYHHTGFCRIIIRCISLNIKSHIVKFDIKMLYLVLVYELWAFRRNRNNIPFHHWSIEDKSWNELIVQDNPTGKWCNMTSKAGHSVTTCKCFYKLLIYNSTYALCDTLFLTLHYTTPAGIIHCAWRIWTRSLQVIWNHDLCWCTYSTRIKTTKNWQLWWSKCYVFQYLTL